MGENETYTHTLVPKQGILAAVKYTVTAYQENISRWTMLPAWEEQKCMLLVGRKEATGITWLWTE